MSLWVLPCIKRNALIATALTLSTRLSDKIAGSWVWEEEKVPAVLRTLWGKLHWLHTLRVPSASNALPLHSSHLMSFWLLHVSGRFPGYLYKTPSIPIIPQTLSSASIYNMLLITLGKKCIYLPLVCLFSLNAMPLQWMAYRLYISAQ